MASSPTPSRLWSFRNADQPPVTLIMSDEQALDRLLRLAPNQQLEPCEGADNLITAIRKELAPA